MTITADMRDIDDFLPRVLAHGTSIPDIVAITGLRDAARDFLQKVPLWRETDTFTVTAPECEAIITLPDAELVRIDKARFRETSSDAWSDLTPTDAASLDNVDSDWDDEELEAGVGGTPTHVLNIFPLGLTIYPKLAGQVNARLVLKPSQDAYRLPDVLYREHAEAIGQAAAAKAMMKPNTEYTNPQLALKMQSDFDMYCDRWKLRVRRSQVNAPVRTKGSFF